MRAAQPSLMPLWNNERLVFERDLQFAVDASVTINFSNTGIQTMAINYRPAKAEDAGECVDLRGKTRQNAVSEEGLRSIGVTAQSWGDNIRSGALPGYICTVDGKIVGYCFGASDSGEIVVLALLPDFENRGIGRELLDRAVKTLAGLGHNRLFLGCSPDPESRSHGFYRQLGWQTTNTFDKYGDEILELHVE